jgi:hypothetical protein
LNTNWFGPANWLIFLASQRFGRFSISYFFEPRKGENGKKIIIQLEGGNKIKSK